MRRNALRAAVAWGCGAAIAGCSVWTYKPVKQNADAAVPETLTPTGGEPYHGLIQYRAKDAKTAIVKPRLVAASDAMIAPGTKVIGVSIGGEARAYPLFILNNHQIVNDRVGKVPISASW